MKHQTILFSTLLGAGLLMAATTQAQVYECRDSRGNHSYSEQPNGNNCRAVSIRNTGTFSTVPAYQPPPTASDNNTATTAHAPTSAANGQRPQIQAAQQQLKAAQQALEEGKKVRYGNERNYAKYLERIQGLENNVKAAQQALQQAQQTQ